MNDFDLLIEEKKKELEVPNRCVVRLSTSYWHDINGIHMKKTLRYLRKKCSGYNVLDEDVREIGALETFPRIKNLNDCKDGIYEVITCNERSSWETPHIIEDYDYKLIPYEEREASSKITGQSPKNVG